MHDHDQGSSDACRWCDLDRLMLELAGDVGLANLERYVGVELDSLREAGNDWGGQRPVAGLLITVRYGDGPIMSSEEAAAGLALMVKTQMDDSGVFDNVDVDGSVRYS